VDGKNGGGGAYANEKTGSVFGSFRRSSDAAGAVRRLWTGAGPTLARDVPYSALYWFAVEHLRRTATDAAVRWKTETQSAKSPKPGSFARGGDASLTPTESLCAHFFSGAVAGGAVAALTTPLDVVKTRVQIRDAPSLLDFAGGMSKTVPEQDVQATTNAFARRGGLRSVGLFGELSAVARQGGVSALFAGWAPRAARAGPTCGIVLVAYEMAKNAPV
jgi:solute carrier family 25 protein 39/40